MIFLIATVALFSVFYLTGILVLKMMKYENSTAGFSYVVGFFTCLLLFEIIAVPCIFAEASFDLLEMITCLTMSAIAIAGAIIGRKLIVEQTKRIVKTGFGIHYLPLLLFGIALVGSFFSTPAFLSDATLETIRTTIYSNSLFQINPMTGLDFNGAFTMWDKLVSLPLFYAIWCDAFRIDAEWMLKTVTPNLMISLLYALSYVWARNLYSESIRKRTYFLFGMGTLLLFGAYSSQSLFHRVRFLNFTGETVVLAILAPFFIYLCFRIFTSRENRWKNIALLVVVGLSVLCCVKITVAGYWLFFILLLIVCIEVIMQFFKYKKERREDKR